MIILIWLLLLIVAKCAVPPEWTDHLQNIGSEKQLVLVLTRLGLANRLRTIADLYTASRAYQRSLIVIWDVTRDCSAGFSDLFKSGPPGLTILDNRGASSTVPEFIDALPDNISAMNMDELDNIWAPGHTTFVLSSAIMQSDTQVLFTSYDGILTMEGLSCHQYTSLHGSFLTQLVPNPDAQSFADQLYNDYFTDTVMVGVHYRAHDPSQDWAVVPPLLGDATDKVFGQGAEVVDFVAQMKAVVRAQEVVAANPENEGKQVRFFVASNSAEAKRALCAEFPSAIFLSGEHRRDSVDGMKLALVEWIMLSRSALLLHTYGSTFAEQAAMVRGVPIVGIWEGRLLQHTSVDLPHCGSQQYARTFGNEQRTGTYTTGVNTDPTEVEGVFLPLHATNNLLARWGLQDVLYVGDAEQ